MRLTERTTASLWISYWRRDMQFEVRIHHQVGHGTSIILGYVSQRRTISFVSYLIVAHHSGVFVLTMSCCKDRMWQITCWASSWDFERAGLDLWQILRQCSTRCEFQRSIKLFRSSSGGRKVTQLDHLARIKCVCISLVQYHLLAVRILLFVEQLWIVRWWLQQQRR